MGQRKNVYKNGSTFSPQPASQKNDSELLRSPHLALSTIQPYFSPNLLKTFQTSEEDVNCWLDKIEIIINN